MYAPAPTQLYPYGPPLSLPDSLPIFITSLIRHLHDFARDVRLTEPEWLAGILFLTRTCHLCSDVRQEFILLSDTLGLSQLVVAQSHSRPETVSEQTVFVPFHVEGAPTRPPHVSHPAQELGRAACRERVG